jgi:type II secretory pathway pseudopilin PulG
MKRLIRQFESKMGFTIVELLTVMSIIIILIGLLVPSLNAARRYASDVKQKAQFHSIDAALELFKNEFEVYPDSSTAGQAPDKDEAGADYPGAARLCEAMVGQDLLGFNPNSHFRSDCTDGTNPVYDNSITSSSWATLSLADAATNLQSRKGPYLPLEKAHAFKLSDIYGNTLVTGNLASNLVLCDEYARVKSTNPANAGKRIGMPILYYKANPSGTRHDPNSTYKPTGTDNKGQFYNYLDNDYLVGLGMPWNPPSAWGGDPKHPMFADYTKFYINTKNNNITISEGRPYRSDSYILISAGYDGQYGTADDIFNFEKE